MVIKQYRKQQKWYFRYLNHFINVVELILTIGFIVLVVLSIVDSVNLIRNVRQISAAGDVGQTQDKVSGLRQLLNITFETSGTFDKVKSYLSGVVILIGCTFLWQIIANSLYGARCYDEYKKFINSKSILTMRIVKHTITIVCAIAMMIVFFLSKNIVHDIVVKVVTPVQSSVKEIKQLLKDTSIQNLDQLNEQWINDNQLRIKEALKPLDDIAKNSNFETLIGAQNFKNLITYSAVAALFGFISFLKLIILSPIIHFRIKAFEPSSDVNVATNNVQVQTK